MLNNSSKNTRLDFVTEYFFRIYLHVDEMG